MGKSAEGIFIATGGVEWEIIMPASDARSLETEALSGSEVSAYIWLYHREDSMKLFGFNDEERRRTFLELLKVEGIGPKAAIKIMGGITQEELERALEAGDLARLEAVPGLGKKTAQKMLLSLKGKLVHAEAGGKASPFDDLAEALTGMGYDRKRAIDALNRAAALIAGEDGDRERENAIFRKAIEFLTKGQV